MESDGGGTSRSAPAVLAHLEFLYSFPCYLLSPANERLSFLK